MEDKRRTALFLDADGTLIETKSGKTFPENKDDWQFRERVVEKLAVMAKDFDFVFIVTNQGGIELGHANHFEMREKFNEVVRLADKLVNLKIQEVLMSPYNSYHYTRKPNPEFAYRMAIKYQLDLQKCVMIGDASGIEEKVLVGKDKDGQHYFVGNLFKGDQISGKPVPENLISDIKTNELGIGYLYWRKDFSNSDLQFARNAGMRYMDVERFLREEIVDGNDLMFYSKIN